MSNKYIPNRWVLIQIGDVQKVLAGWSGGYLDGDSWRLSSGVEDTEEDGDYYIFKNYSGSKYKCHKEAEGLTTLTSSIYNRILKEAEEAGKEVKIIEMREEDEAN